MKLAVDLRDLSRALPVVAAALMLSACALPGYDRYPPGSKPPGPRVETREPPPPIYAPPSKPVGKEVPTEPESPAPTAPRTAERTEAPRNPAVVELSQQADAYVQQGRLAEAAASLERAQRIAPRDPLVYQSLAEVRLAQKKAVQAEQLARKSLALASGRPPLQADLWGLIAQCKQAQGDAEGAQAAEDEARRLRRDAWRWWK